MYFPPAVRPRFSSPLGVYDFVKRTSLISYSQEALAQTGKVCRTLAEMEDLDAHSKAVEIRLS